MTAYGHLRYIKNEGNFILGISKEGETSCLQNKVLAGHGLNANLQYNLKVVFFFFKSQESASVAVSKEQQMGSL